ncbi:MAG: lysophospholipid acyltransferase family protein [Chloroflexi bacterium]|nr:lysophospholipid acyltransferase family protein [Chloroflexota bacterium]
METVRNQSADNEPVIWWRAAIDIANRLHFTYWIIRILGFVAHILPIRVSYGITIFLAHLVYYSWPALRSSVIKNMRQVLGPEADESLVKEMSKGAFRNYFKYLVDFLRFPHVTSEELERVIHSSGWENLDRALEFGKGVIFIGFHFGNWDLAGAIMGMRGYPLNVVAESFEPERLNELIQRYRIEKGMRIIPLETAARKVLRSLRQNEILGLLIDRPEPQSGVPVEFFGNVARVPAGAATLALKTGAKLVLGYLVRCPDNTFTGGITPQIDFEATGDPTQDIQRLTQQIMHAVEDLIRSHPDQWYMFRDMWEQPVQASHPVAAGG